MIIAQSALFEYKNGEWKAFLIKLHQPELDEISKIDYCCLIEIGDDDAKRIYGIDSLQTIILSVGYLKNRMKVLKENGLRLFLDKQLEQEIDIDVVLRNDLSFFIDMKLNIGDKGIHADKKKMHND